MGIPIMEEVSADRRGESCLKVGRFDTGRVRREGGR